MQSCALRSAKIRVLKEMIANCLAGTFLCPGIAQLGVFRVCLNSIAPFEPDTLSFRASGLSRGSYLGPRVYSLGLKGGGYHKGI